MRRTFLTPTDCRMPHRHHIRTPCIGIPHSELKSDSNAASNRRIGCRRLAARESNSVKNRWTFFIHWNSCCISLQRPFTPTTNVLPLVHVLFNVWMPFVVCRCSCFTNAFHCVRLLFTNFAPMWNEPKPIMKLHFICLCPLCLLSNALPFVIQHYRRGFKLFLVKLFVRKWKIYVSTCCVKASKGCWKCSIAMRRRHWEASLNLTSLGLTCAIGLNGCAIADCWK